MIAWHVPKFGHRRSRSRENLPEEINTPRLEKKDFRFRRFLKKPETRSKNPLFDTTKAIPGQRKKEKHTRKECRKSFGRIPILIPHRMLAGEFRSLSIEGSNSREAGSFESHNGLTHCRFNGPTILTRLLMCGKAESVNTFRIFTFLSMMFTSKSKDTEPTGMLPNGRIFLECW